MFPFDFLPLESALCGCYSHYPLGLSSFIVTFTVPNMVSRYTPDLPKQMKCVLTSPSSLLTLYHSSRLFLFVSPLIHHLILPRRRSPFQYINESLRPLNFVACEYGAKNKRQLREFASSRAYDSGAEEIEADCSGFDNGSVSDAGCRSPCPKLARQSHRCALLCWHCVPLMVTTTRAMV
jgi:hypothetical protein